MGAELLIKLPTADASPDNNIVIRRGKTIENELFSLKAFQ